MASITQTANPAGVSASSNVATYSAQSIGDAVPDRIIAVVVGSELASTPIASCTIDYGSGDTAMTAGTQGNQGAVYARTFYLAVPTGTTATIKVTFTTNSPTSTQNHIAVYRILDAVYSSTGADQSTDMDATDPLTTGSTTIGTGGVMLAVAARAGGTGGQDTWANLTEDLDVDGGAFGFTTAFSTTAGTATRTCTAVTTGEDGALSWLIFADNTSPTTALNSPADAATGVSTTPVLDFTGTDADGNDVRYNVQISPSSDFYSDITVGTPQTQTGTAVSSLTKSVTPSGTNRRLLIAVVSRDTTPADQVVSGVTVDGNAATFIALEGDTLGMKVEWWEYIAPPASVIDVVATYTGTVDGAGMVIYPLSGADQTLGSDVIPVGSSGFATAISNVVTTVTNKCKVFDIVFSKLDTAFSLPVGASQTDVGEIDIGGDTMVSSYETKATAGATTMSWDNSADGGDDMASLAIAIRPAFSGLDKVSGTDSGFANPDNGGDTDPFTSGENIQYTVQSALSNSTVYYWRVRGIDPSGSNSYGAWSTARSFTVTAGGGTSVKDLIGGGFIPFAR